MRIKPKTRCTTQHATKHTACNAIQQAVWRWTCTRLPLDQSDMICPCGRWVILIEIWRLHCAHWCFSFSFSFCWRWLPLLLCLQDGRWGGRIRFSVEMHEIVSIGTKFVTHKWKHATDRSVARVFSCFDSWVWTPSGHAHRIHSAVVHQSTNDWLTTPEYDSRSHSFCAVSLYSTSLLNCAHCYRNQHYRSPFLTSTALFW